MEIPTHILFIFFAETKNNNKNNTSKNSEKYFRVYPTYKKTGVPIYRKDQ